LSASEELRERATRRPGVSEYSLRSISQRFPVALLSAQELSWQRQYVSWFVRADLSEPLSARESVQYVRRHVIH